MRRVLITAAALVAVAVCCPAGARVDPPKINPYRLWWSFPGDDKTSIEIDDPDLAVSAWETRWQFARAMQSCDAKLSSKLAVRRDRSVREVKIETLDGDGEVRAAARCVMTNRAWRARLGDSLFERLEGELDAHDAFLHPRSYPGMPPAPVTPRQATP